MSAFSDRFLPVPATCVFEEDGYYVWCGSMTRCDGTYYLAYSRWKRALGFEAWVTDSEICLAAGDAPDGTFHYVKTIRSRDGLGKWDSSCAHNPTILYARGKYYLYYMGNDGDGTWWTNRNRQRIGVAVADTPDGVWTFFDQPVLDVTPGGIDSLLVSNPTVTETPDGRFLMVYKAVDHGGPLPRGGSVVCGAAFADHPVGPFYKVGTPIFVNPEDPWSVEDPFVWTENGCFHALCSDFHGYFTGKGSRSAALFRSQDGVHWEKDEVPLAFSLCYPTADGTVRMVYRLERPQLFFEDGKMRFLLCACAEDDAYRKVYNVRIPLKV